jgi:hypothetical protein
MSMSRTTPEWTTLPRNAAQLKELGVGYCNYAPSPEVRMLKSMQAQVAEARRLL